MPNKLRGVKFYFPELAKVQFDRIILNALRTGRAGVPGSMQVKRRRWGASSRWLNTERQHRNLRYSR